MYAVVRTGGKQYRVAKDDVIVVEKLDAAPGEVIELGSVLAMSDGVRLTLGEPLVDGASVTATVLEQKRDGKIVVFKKKRRKNYRRTRGHRQSVTVLRIGEIRAESGIPAPEIAAPAEEDPVAEPERPEAAEPVEEGRAAESERPEAANETDDGGETPAVRQGD